MSISLSEMCRIVEKSKGLHSFVSRVMHILRVSLGFQMFLARKAGFFYNDGTAPR